MPASKIRLTRADYMLIMRARAAELEAAMTELETEFQKRPRRHAMTDRYCHLWNTTHYGTSLAYDAEYYGCAPQPAIERMDRDLAKIRLLIAKLRDDPYVCQSQKLIDKWGKDPGTPWRDCYGLNARQWRRPTEAGHA
jgi:hypothetical protein